MSVPCSTCTHPELRAITGALLRSEPFGDIAARFGLTADALRAHASRHLGLKRKRFRSDEDRAMAELRRLALVQQYVEAGA